MKHTLTLIALLVLALQGIAQKSMSRRDRQDLRVAQLALSQGDHALVYQLLEPLYERDSTNAEINLALGQAALNWKGDKAFALKLLAAAAKTLPEARFHHARALHRNLRFDEAYQSFLAYVESGDRSIAADEVLRHIDQVTRAKEALANPADVRVTNLGPSVNSAAPEYVPVVTPDNQRLYFTSRRSDSTGGLKDPNNAFFEDIYFTLADKTGWSTATNIGTPINSNTHDATVSISADGKTMVVYRTNENQTGGDLYISRLRDGAWSTPEKLPATINSEFQEASASLSADGQLLIFSSNRPGGFGGKDLYRVRMLPNGQWSLPRNLGPIVNTPYDEDAPHLDVDGKTLYFASNGHSTIGGYDIFRSVKADDELWSTPKNLGFPVNTVDDDLYLTLDAGGRTGYFSSAREGGFGDQDLYSIDFVYRRQATIVVKGKLNDLEGNPVAATITVIDEATREVQGVYRSNRLSGKFIAVLHPLTPYKVLIEAEGYTSIIDEMAFPFPETADQKEVELTPYLLIAP